MKWLLPGSKLTTEYEERAFLGGLTDALLSSNQGRVFLEMDTQSDPAEHFSCAGVSRSRGSGIEGIPYCDVVECDATPNGALLALVRRLGLS